MSEHSPITIARFWEKVDIRGPDECWPWKASRCSGGYGKCTTRSPNKRTRGAHIIAFEVSIGPTNDLDICHTCDNPPCCNPAHLWRGTTKQNIQDMIAKGRRFQFRGSDSGRAILDESKVDEIRVLIASGLPYKLIAPRFGISVQTISAINTGVAWKHHVSPTRSSQPAS